MSVQEAEAQEVTVLMTLVLGGVTVDETLPEPASPASTRERVAIQSNIARDGECSSHGNGTGCRRNEFRRRHLCAIHIRRDDSVDETLCMAYLKGGRLSIFRRVGGLPRARPNAIATYIFALKWNIP